MESEKPETPAVPTPGSPDELDESQLEQVSGGSKWELAELDAIKTFNPKDLTVDRIKGGL